MYNCFFDKYTSNKFSLIIKLEQKIELISKL